MKPNKISAALAGLSLIWGTAFAQSGPVEAPEIPSIIILELEPMQPGQIGPLSEADHAMLGMLLMQLLATLEAEGNSQELQIVVPTADPGVGI
jgi:hypothetical protein